MVGVPIGDQAMTPTERTRRKRQMDKQREIQSRIVLMEAAHTFLRYHEQFKAKGEASEARAALMQAERCINAANGDPEAPLVISIIDGAALVEREKLEYREVLSHLERQKGAEGAP